MSFAPHQRVRPVAAALLGALAGLALFGLESALVLRGGAFAVNVDTQGPFAAVLAAVRPHLPWLLARIATAYVVAGALLGLSAALLVFALGLERPFRRRLGFGLELSALVLVLAWARAIARPALFDDLPSLRWALAFLVDHGEPWHPLLAAAALGCSHWVSAFRPAKGRLGRFGAVWLALGCVAPLWMGSTPPGLWSPPETPRTPLAAEARPPLIVVVGLDAFRPDRLKAYGGTGAVAPNLEAFLSEATRFDRAYTPIAQTEPAWRGILTARWPPATGVRHPLTPRARWAMLPTFTQSLRQAGFRTTFATDCSRFNFQDESSGFERRLQPPHGAINFALERLRYRGLGLFADNALGAWWTPELVDNRAIAGVYDPYGYATRLARVMVDEASFAAPSLFAFHATAAHFPGDPVFPHYRRFVPETERLNRRLRMFFSPISTGAKAEDGWGRAQSEQLYDEVLSQADAQLGILLQALEDNGLYDGSLIVVFSDHGESFHVDHSELAGATPVHGARLQDDENRVLLAIKPPGGRRIERVEELVRLIDLGPTILELAKAPPLPGADGVSLAPLLRGEPLAALLLYAETGFTHASPDAFDSEHLAGAPRTFDAYQVEADGVVEMTPAAHERAILEKDVGAFDGRCSIVRSPRRDSTVLERREGACDASTLEVFLDQVVGTGPSAL